MALSHPSQPVDVDAEFLRYRGEVLEFLRHDYPNAPDPEDLYQEAWFEVVKLRRSGAVVGNVAALLTDKAKQRAIDEIRRHRPTPVGVGEPMLIRQADPSPGPDQVVEAMVTANVVRQIVADIGHREAAIVKLRFDLDLTTAEIARRLGLKPKLVEKLTTKTYKAVLDQLAEDATGETMLARRQRSLLLTCLNGTASPEQLARARQQVAEDPACRAMLARLRETIERVAAILPLPVLGETHHQHGVGVLEQLNQTSASLRDAITVATPRVSGSSWLEPITGSATTLGAAGAAKVVVICLSFGGGAAVCINAGVFGRDDPAGSAVAREPTRSKPAKNERVATIRPRPAATPTPVRKAQTVARQASAPPPPKANGPAPASPAPPGSTEFGVGSVGSQPASREPAAAPVDGGGEFTP